MYQIKGRQMHTRYICTHTTTAGPRTTDGLNTYIRLDKSCCYLLSVTGFDRH